MFVTIEVLLVLCFIYFEYSRDMLYIFIVNGLFACLFQMPGITFFFSSFRLGTIA